jgi:ubiquinol-cytochrome c reductase iron-sulfur subunit
VYNARSLEFAKRRRVHRWSFAPARDHSRLRAAVNRRARCVRPDIHKGGLQMTDKIEGEEVDLGRRRLLSAATAATGVVGIAFAATPFLASWKPSARAKALGAPVEIDASKLEAGSMLKVEWRGKPVWVLRRTPEMLATLEKDTAMLLDPASEASTQPDYAKNPARAKNPEYFVVLGVCTHLGCSPLAKFTPGDVTVSADWPGGFYCPCHGSKFDLAGRVYKGVPAPSNLAVPPYTFLADGRILVGSEGAAA